MVIAACEDFHYYSNRFQKRAIEVLTFHLHENVYLISDVSNDSEKSFFYSWKFEANSNNLRPKKS